jgi:hypothetical protein
MDAQDLTHAEAAKAFREFQSDVGPSAAVSISVNTGRHNPSRANLTATVWPDGVGSLKNNTIRADGDTYAELFDAIKAEWDKQKDAHGAKTIREMALKIISITADDGACSEFSLCKAFSAGEVKTYGDRACEEATRIAGNGPFSIVRAASESEAA